MAILSFYTETTTGDLTVIETLEYDSVPGQLDLLSSSVTETDQRTFIVKKYLFIPEKIKMIIKKGMVAKNLTTKFIVHNQETFLDHQEIILLRENK